MTRFRVAPLCLAVLVLLASGVLASSQGAPSLPLYGYTVVRSYPHDVKAFTQGLEFVDGVFYEGTGLVGQSSIRKVKVETGEVLQRRALPVPHFGEGISILQGRMFQLTWQSGLAFVYDPSTFRELRSFKYTGEGWGLTHDRTHLIMSDGSESLRFVDPATFQEVRRVRVMAVGAPVKNLNELEFVKGEVFANVWMTDYIARIDPASGKVNSYIDLRGLLPQREAEAVLNGIAYDEKGDRLFVTGKLWPRVFEIKLVAK